MSGRSLLTRLGAPALCLAVLTGSVFAQTWPTRPIRVIVPFTAGSPIEVPARTILQRVAEKLGQSFVIENRPGASGIIGTEIVAKAPRDGHTLLFTNCSHSSNPAHFKKLPYDTLQDFAPITQTNGSYGNMLVVHTSVPARSVKEFIRLARAFPGKLHYATAGVGSPPHITGALFAVEAGIQLTHVPYKGTSAAFTDVLSGYVEAMFASITFAQSHVEAGRVRALGIGGPRRIPLLPDVPTFDEAGLPGFALTCYHGMWFPAGVQGEIVRKLQAEVAKALAIPEVHKHLTNNALIPVGSTPEEFEAFLRNDIAHNKEIARKIGLQPQ